MSDYKETIFQNTVHTFTLCPVYDQAYPLEKDGYALPC